jgi:hypothetical protein
VVEHAARARANTMHVMDRMRRADTKVTSQVSATPTTAAIVPPLQRAKGRFQVGLLPPLRALDTTDTKVKHIKTRHQARAKARGVSYVVACTLLASARTEMIALTVEGGQLDQVGAAERAGVAGAMLIVAQHEVPVGDPLQGQGHCHRHRHLHLYVTRSLCLLRQAFQRTSHLKYASSLSQGCLRS